MAHSLAFPMVERGNYLYGVFASCRERKWYTPWHYVGSGPNSF